MSVERIIAVGGSDYIIVVTDVDACVDHNGRIVERHPFADAGRLKAVASATISALRLAETAETTSGQVISLASVR